MPRKQEKNSPELWDGIWSEKSIDHKEILYTVLQEKRGSIWEQLRNTLVKKYGSLQALRVIELGAGAGTYSILMAQEGAEITILDYSSNAIARSKDFLKKLNIEAEFILGDALTLDDTLKKNYDISMSFGLAEHFQHDERLRIIQSHFDLLRENGSTFISVPNKHCLPYRMWKTRRELQGNWPYGEEYPFSRHEFRKICHHLGVKKYCFMGSSFLSSLDFILPFSTWSNSLKKRIWPATYDPFNPEKIKVGKKSFLDQYVGYALILSAEK